MTPDERAIALLTDLPYRQKNKRAYQESKDYRSRSVLTLTTLSMSMTHSGTSRNALLKKVGDALNAHPKVEQLSLSR